MKSVLLHVYEDSGLEGRLQVALDFCRAHDAHLTCLHVTPYNAYVAFDPLGGTYSQGAIMEELAKREEEMRAQFETNMAKEDVRWDWAAADGDVVQLLSAWSAMSDVVIVSQTGKSAPLPKPLPIVDDLVVHSECPVLLVPQGVSSFPSGQPVIVAWNASAEAANTIRASLPVLAAASQVQVVSVADHPEDFPQTAAATYLTRHGIGNEIFQIAGEGRKPWDVLSEFARTSGAGLVVMGAYGRSRFRETLLGGVTRNLLEHAAVPLLLGR